MSKIRMPQFSLPFQSGSVKAWPKNNQATNSSKFWSLAPQLNSCNSTQPKCYHDFFLMQKNDESGQHFPKLHMVTKKVERCWRVWHLVAKIDTSLKSKFDLNITMTLMLVMKCSKYSKITFSMVATHKFQSKNLRKVNIRTQQAKFLEHNSSVFKQ